MEFTKDDLKAGYVCKFRNRSYKMVTETQRGIILSDNSSWYRHVSAYENNLRYGFGPVDPWDIMRVYGFVDYPSLDLKITDISTRELLWERKEPKELTMQEIADKFGVDVKDLKIKK